MEKLTGWPPRLDEKLRTGSRPRSTLGTSSNLEPTANSNYSVASASALVLQGLLVVGCCLTWAASTRSTTRALAAKPLPRRPRQPQRSCGQLTYPVRSELQLTGGRSQLGRRVATSRPSERKKATGTTDGTYSLRDLASLAVRFGLD